MFCGVVCPFLFSLCIILFKDKHASFWIICNYQVVAQVWCLCPSIWIYSCVLESDLTITENFYYPKLLLHEPACAAITRAAHSLTSVSGCRTSSWFVQWAWDNLTIQTDHSKMDKGKQWWPLVLTACWLWYSMRILHACQACLSLIFGFSCY